MAEDPALTAFVAWLSNARDQQAPKKPVAKKTAAKAGPEYAR
jgi:LysR family glycine cleavage system transcriptional activator